MVGLGPQRAYDDESIVMSLARDGLIDAAQVGLNFEDPMDPSLRTSLTFGYYDEDHINRGSRRGLNYFPNVGNDTWAMSVIDPLCYDG